ncbi:hypothetical protein EKO27_g11480 [Xylaria grammica]|uniref:Uncharacterized protein n=1 Tax=Xylaria grammica TaxID=363999 RepID=A0A439CN99_9PEZI|nr:hypothetical protein EKO27_g11480 [Xylaria grammica]
MLASTLLFSLSAFAAAVSASAIPQLQLQQRGLAKRQNTATIPTFSYGPSTTVYLGGGSATGSTQQASETATNTSSKVATDSKVATSSKAATSSLAATSSAADSTASSTAAAGTGGATGTIPTYSFFPSSTVQVGGPTATSQPSAGNGTGDKDGGNGAADGAGDDDDDGQTDGQTGLDKVAGLLQQLLDLLGN